MSETFNIRQAKPEEYVPIGQIMVEAYSQLEDFPNPDEQPAYFELLANIGRFTVKPGVELLAAVSSSGMIGGAVLYFGQMSEYGSGGPATKETNAGGFRLLAVSNQAKGQGLGKQLSLACIDKARQQGHTQVIIHSTKAMQLAWGMYERLGFVRSEDLDFMQEDLPVYGFRLALA